MKTEVTLNSKMVKRYYLDLFLSGPIYLSLASLIFGTIGATFYMMQSTKIGGIAIEAISIFLAIVIYLLTQNNKKIALAELELSERTFYIEFSLDKMEIQYNKSIKTIEYTNIKVRKLPRFYQFREKEGSTLIYIIPIEYFSYKEWEEISKPINKALKEEKIRKKEEKSHGHNN